MEPENKKDKKDKSINIEAVGFLVSSIIRRVKEKPQTVEKEKPKSAEEEKHDR